MRLTYKSIIVVVMISSFLIGYFFLGKEKPTKVKPWPVNSKIIYYSDSYEESIATAISQWEKTGLKVNFVKTENIHEANLVFHNDQDKLESICTVENCVGFADHLGYSKKQNNIYLKDNGERNAQYVSLIIHELGHVLGLQHGSKACSVMAKGNIDCPIGEVEATRSGAQYSCGPWESDIKQLQTLYSSDFIVPGNCSN